MKKRKLLLLILIPTLVIGTLFTILNAAIYSHKKGAFLPVEYAVKEITDREVNYSYTLERPTDENVYTYSVSIYDEEKITYYHCIVFTDCNHGLYKLVNYAKRKFKADEIKYIHYRVVYGEWF